MPNSGHGSVRRGRQRAEVCRPANHSRERRDCIPCASRSDCRISILLRQLWDCCGTSVELVQLTFVTTHGGMGGVPWIGQPPISERLATHGYISEIFTVANDTYHIGEPIEVTTDLLVRLHHQPPLSWQTNYSARHLARHHSAARPKINNPSWSTNGCGQTSEARDRPLTKGRAQNRQFQMGRGWLFCRHGSGFPVDCGAGLIWLWSRRPHGNCADGPEQMLPVAPARHLCATSPAKFRTRPNRIENRWNGAASVGPKEIVYVNWK